MKGPDVLVVMGSPSDRDVMGEAAKVLAHFGVDCETRVLSAHRCPQDTANVFSVAAGRGVKVVICGAGMSAHLAGAAAANTTLPVIGVPLSSGALDGLDALLATVNMPPGVPVATVGMGVPGAKNAALLAVSILALSNADLATKLAKYREEMRKKVLAADEEARGV